MAAAAVRVAALPLPGAGVQVAFKVVLSGSYATGGNTLALHTLYPNLITIPVFCSIIGKAGFVYEYTFGTDASDGKLLVRVNTGAGADAALPEHTAAAYAAALTGDEIRGFAWWK